MSFLYTVLFLITYSTACSVSLGACKQNRNFVLNNETYKAGKIKSLQWSDDKRDCRWYTQTKM